MSKKQELMDAIQQYPERRLIAMFSNEGNSDYAYSLGEIIKVEVTETTTYNEERVFSVMNTMNYWKQSKKIFTL